MNKALVSLLITTLLLPQISLATSFNPNYIISDETLQNKDSMDIYDIQAFLQEKNSTLANFVTDYQDTGKRKASYIIYDSAQKYTINPAYLLVKLQKEQSLITAKNPTQNQLDWATGFGVCDSCSKSDSGIQDYRGFGNQVESAALVIRSYYNKVATQNWIKRAGETYNIDGLDVTPANNATAFLYTYTPHLHGNENFWTIWQDWFEQSYPDGTLARTIDSPDVYLIQDGQKRKIANMTSLLTRFDPKLILTIPQSELNKLEEGNSIKLPNYAIAHDGLNYYLLDNDYKRQFTNYDVVRQIGYNPDEIIEVNSSDLDGYTTGEPISLDEKNITGRVVKLKTGENLYYIKGNTYSPILDKNTAKINFPNLEIEEVDSSEFDKLTSINPVIPKNGSLIGLSGNPNIYVMENGKKRHIADEKTFNTYGYNWHNIVWIDFFAGLIIPDGEPLHLLEQVDNLDTTSSTSLTTNS